MKYNFLILLVITGIVFSACRKDRTCTCTITTTEGDPHEFWNKYYFKETTETTIYSDIKKKKARDLCISSDKTIPVNDTLYHQIKTECTLK